MITSYLRVLRLAVAASLLLPVVVTIASKLHTPQDILPEFWLLMAGCGVAAAGAALILARMLRRVELHLEAEATAQSEFLAAIPERYTSAAIAGAATLSLFVELALIRWQGSVFEFFAFYKNFGLLACFAGLGFGYALAARRHIP
ncbi:MAG TPA: hypothetical protein VGA40_01530, partial [Candidatus Acidoferrales bacterium]